MEFIVAANTLRPLGQGFLLCASIIMALGPQNMFILRQGLQRLHLFATALICTLVDVVMISVGVGGVGGMVASHRDLMTAITIVGAIFLMWCGGCSLLAASRKPKPQTSIMLVSPVGLKSTIV